MEPMTAEQAAEAAKGMTFEQVWAIMIKTDARLEETAKQMRENQEETARKLRETQEELARKLRETQEETDRKFRETQEELDKSLKRSEKVVADLSKNIGGLGNALGRFTETMFSTELWKKFSELGYNFTRQAPHVKYMQLGRVIAEVDFFLENGEYAMPVEIKTELSIADVNDHLERIGKIRQYMDERGDTRKLVGAVAGGIISDDLFIYAHKRGLFVIKQTGESVAVADAPPGFKPREWRTGCLK